MKKTFAVLAYAAAIALSALPFGSVSAESASQQQEQRAIALPSATVLPQEGEFSVQDGVAVVSKSWRFVIAFQFAVPSKFDKITLVRAQGIQDGTAVFLFKPKDAASQTWQIPVSLASGSFELPQELDSQNFEYFGLAVASPRAEFSDISPSFVTFGDRVSGLFAVESQKPSTINLLYWHKWGTTPLVAVLWFLVLAAGFVFIIVGKPKYALATLLAVWISYDLLLVRDQFFTMETTENSFLSPADPQDRTYFDFGNLYAFVDATRDCLAGQEGWINLYAPSEWPFWHNVSYHLIPRKVTWNTKDQIFYAAFAGGEYKDWKFSYRWVLVDENVVPVCSVKGGSLILKKTK